MLGRPDDSLMPVKAKRHGETIIVAFSRPVDSSQIQVFFIGDDDHEQKSVESSIGMRHAFKKWSVFSLNTIHTSCFWGISLHIIYLFEDANFFVEMHNSEVISNINL